MKMKKVVIIGLLFLTSQSIIQAQENNTTIPEWMLEADAGFCFTPNGNTYGLIVAGTKPLLLNRKNNFSLDMSLQGSFTVKSEGGFEGVYGTTSNSEIGLAFGPSVYLFSSKRLIIKPQIFCGVAYKSTNMGIDNESLNIEQSYKDRYFFFSRGVFIQAGYGFKKDFMISAFFKADLRRLTNGDHIAEYPELLYGVGIAKKIHRR